MYSNAAGTIPIVQALLGKGLPLGTTLAFMMAVTAISLPEFVILRRVIKPPLLAVFAGVVTTGIVAIGFLFNVPDRLNAGHSQQGEDDANDRSPGLRLLQLPPPGSQRSRGRSYCRRRGGGSPRDRSA
jgi:hypothetical protein